MKVPIVLLFLKHLLFLLPIVLFLLVTIQRNRGSLCFFTLLFDRLKNVLLINGSCSHLGNVVWELSFDGLELSLKSNLMVHELVLELFVALWLNWNAVYLGVQFHLLLGQYMGIWCRLRFGERVWFVVKALHLSWRLYGGVAFMRRVKKSGGQLGSFRLWLEAVSRGSVSI